MAKKECTNFELVERFYELPLHFVEMEKRKFSNEQQRNLEAGERQEPHKQMIPILDRLFASKGNYPLM